MKSTKTKIKTMGKNKTTKLFILGTITLLVIAFLSIQVSALSKPGVKSAIIQDSDILLQDGEYVSPIYQTDFKFNLAGFAWQGQGQTAVYLRFYDADGWSNWYSPESEDYFAKDGWYYNTEPIFAAQAEKIQYRIDTTGNVERLKLIYISSKNEKNINWNLFDRLFGVAQANETLDIISRTEWEADEDWRLNSENNEVWPTEYQWPEKFVIHHTAGSDGDDDPAATIRGVYYWHAVVLGWGDIGYHYLIDQEGNIYEGRAGGDGVIGAHVYRSEICAKQRFGGTDYEADFNPGTIGIAILGDYENGLVVNDAVRQAMAELIGHKAKDFNIVPEGTSNFIDDVYPNIVGHKDLDCTDCPGKNLYNEFNSIRAAAQKVYEELGGITDPVVKAVYVGQSEQPVEVATGQEKEVWVEFRNDGNTTWRSYTQETLTVLARSSSSGFYVAGWESPTVVARLTTPNVAPGEVGRFVFTIKGPQDQLELTEEFVLQFGDQVLDNTTFSITAQVVGLKFAGSLDNQNILPASFTSSRHSSAVQYLNLGTETWQRGDVKLEIFDLGDNVSRYYDYTWPTKEGSFDFNESSVAPGELATFEFTYKTPDEPGLFLNIYRLSGIEGLVYKEDHSITRVDSRYQAELAGFNIPPAVLTTWRPTVTISYKNTGIATWDRTVGLQVLDYNGNISRFYDHGWDDVRMAVHLSERSVKPGEVGTFTFSLRSPNEVGLFYNKFRVFKDGKPVPGGDLSMITRVDN